MPGTPTTKYAIPTLNASGTDAINVSHTALNSAFTTIDGAMAGYAEGTFAGKPAAGKTGRIYRCTDTGQWLADTGAAWVDLNAAPALVSSLPGSPYDGQEIYFAADATNGVVWHLRYRSASASTYKWESVGGGSLNAEINTFQSTTTASWVDLATVGPQITVPLAGDYEIDYGARMQAASGGVSPQMAIKIGAAAVDGTNDQLNPTAGTVQLDIPVSKSVRRTVSAASAVVKMQYGSGGPPSSVGFAARTLRIRPIRVG